MCVNAGCRRRHSGHCIDGVDGSHEHVRLLGIEQGAGIDAGFKGGISNDANGPGPITVRPIGRGDVLAEDPHPLIFHAQLTISVRTQHDPHCPDLAGFDSIHRSDYRAW